MTQEERQLFSFRAGLLMDIEQLYESHPWLVRHVGQRLESSATFRGIADALRAPTMVSRDVFDELQLLDINAIRELDEWIPRDISLGRAEE